MIRRIDQLKDFKNFYLKTEQERESIFKKYKDRYSPLAIRIAKFLGLKEVELCQLILSLEERHEIAEDKVRRKKKVTEDERDLLDIVIDTEMSEAIVSEEQKAEQFQEQIHLRMEPSTPPLSEEEVRKLKETYIEEKKKNLYKGQMEQKMELEPPTSFLTTTEVNNKRKETPIKEKPEGKRREKDTYMIVDKETIEYNPWRKMELEPPVSLLIQHIPNQKRRSPNQSEEQNNKKRDCSFDKRAEVNLNESEKEMLNLDKSPNLEKKVTLSFAKVGSQDPGVKETEEFMVMRHMKKPKASTSQETQNKEKLTSREDINASRWAPKDIHTSIWAPKNRKELPTQEKSFYNQSRKSEELIEENAVTKNSKFEIDLTIWDVPKNLAYQRVSRCLSFYGRITIERQKDVKRGQAMYLHVVCWNKQRYEQLKELWLIHLEEGRMCYIILGIFDEETLEERRRFAAVLFGLPKTALESMLLRQLKHHRVKAVYIPFDSKGHQRDIAFAYFENEIDCNRAQKTNAQYYNYRLTWSRVNSTRNQNTITEQVLTLKQQEEEEDKENHEAKKRKRVLTEYREDNIKIKLPLKERKEFKGKEAIPHNKENTVPKKEEIDHAGLAKGKEIELKKRKEKGDLDTKKEEKEEESPRPESEKVVLVKNSQDKEDQRPNKAIREIINPCYKDDILNRIEEHQTILQEILKRLDKISNGQVNPAHSS
jgi:hypothetical protein